MKVVYDKDHVYVFYVWIWLSLSYVPWFSGTVYAFVSIYNVQGTHDKLNQIQIQSGDLGVKSANIF